MCGLTPEDQILVYQKSEKALKERKTNPKRAERVRSGANDQETDSERTRERKTGKETGAQMLTLYTNQRRQSFVRSDF